VIDFMRVGAVSGILLATALAAIFITSGFLSTANARTETAVFLRDVAERQTLLLATVWVAGAFSFLLTPFFLGLYHGLRHWSEDYMQVSLLAGILATVLGAVLVMLQAIGAGSIIPAWTASDNEATRLMLLSDLNAVAWGIDAMSRMFDFAIALATLTASFVMLRMGRRWWKTLSWVGIVSGGIHIPIVFLLFFRPSLEPVHFIADATFLLWMLGVGIGLWNVSSVAVRSPESDLGSDPVPLPPIS
jgi:hypothetical protein